MSIRQRAYPDAGQVPVLVSYSDQTRFLHNLVVEQYTFALRYRPFRVGKRRSWPRIVDSGELTEARAANPWLADGSAAIQQQVLRRTRAAYVNWWKRRAKAPKFHKRDGTHSFSVAGPGMNFRVARLNRHWATVTIPKAGPVRFKLTRPWSDIQTARSIHVTCNRAGQWHVSFVAPPGPFEREQTGATVGIDRGVANTVATSDGSFEHIPGLAPSEQATWLRLTRRLAKQQRGSNRYAATLKRRSKITQRLKDRRRDWIEKTTTALVRDYDLIAIEALVIANMTKSAQGTLTNPGRNVRAKAGLNRVILASCWGRLDQRIADKTKQATAPVAYIHVPAAGTSITCAHCGDRSKLNRESQAEFRCRSCGHEQHADVNAARNILARALTMYRATPSGSAGAGRGGPPTREPMKRQTSSPVPDRKAVP